MRYKSSSITIIIFLIICVEMLFYTKNTPVSTLPQPTFIASTTFPLIHTFINRKYKYSFEYPDHVILDRVEEEDRASTEESGLIYMYNPKALPNLYVEIVAWAPYPYATTDPIKVDTNRVSKLDLKSFAEVQHQRLVDDKNPNLPKKTVSDLKMIMLDGTVAYTLTVMNGFDRFGNSNYEYIYANNGTNLLIEYSLEGELSTKVVDTFKLGVN